LIFIDETWAKTNMTRLHVRDQISDRLRLVCRKHVRA
jgi:hypothetical protein